jgi:hypothetical protein
MQNRGNWMTIVDFATSVLLAKYVTCVISTWDLPPKLLGSYGVQPHLSINKPSLHIDVIDFIMWPINLSDTRCSNSTTETHTDLNFINPIKDQAWLRRCYDHTTDWTTKETWFDFRQGKRFFPQQRPDLFRGPHSFLFNGCHRIFHGGKATGTWSRQLTNYCWSYEWIAVYMHSPLKRSWFAPGPDYIFSLLWFQLKKA